MNCQISNFPWIKYKFPDFSRFSRFVVALINTQVLRLCKAFTNNSPAYIVLSKTQLGQSEGFLGGLLGSLLKTGFPLMKNILKLLAKSMLIPLGLTAAAWARDAAIQKKNFGSGITTLIISYEEMNDIMKKVTSLKESGLLIKSISKTIKTEAKVQKSRFLGMLSSTLGASLLGNLLTDKGVVRAGEGTIRAGEL